MAIRVKSRVVRLYTHAEGCYIRLESPEYEPKDGYFLLEGDHANYNTLFSLASMAAMSRRPLSIRTHADIVPTEYARVRYMVLDW
jgi:hypothetical protein